MRTTDAPTIDPITRELAELSAHLEAATHRQLALLRELEPRRPETMRGAGVRDTLTGW